MSRQPTSNVSVDAITLRYNNETRHVEVGVSRRIIEPYLDQLALPGVTLWEGERLADAVERAVQTKLGLGVRAQGQLTVFDEPHRDPRGQTLSVVMWAVADHPEEAPDYVLWYPIEDVPELAFDHNQMIEFCRPLLVDRLWRDLSFTRALTGASFPVSAAVAITRSLTGTAPDRGNLNRRLASVRGLGISHKRVVVGRGRPGTLWEWQSTHLEPEGA
ncbi:MAG: NUDIX hydrolase [Propionibacteriaceae bacterium]|nr:NUDIX hydrolase [Propionibacteriaceae bacterium]